MTSSHPCNKETEIALMTERIKNIDKNVDALRTDFQYFISTADKKYATNERVSNLEKALTSQDTEVKKQENRFYSVMWEVTKWGVAVGVLGKLFGIY